MKDESSRHDDVISAAQRYIEQNGSKAFENLVNKVLSPVKCTILICENGGHLAPVSLLVL